MRPDLNGLYSASGSKAGLDWIRINGSWILDWTGSFSTQST